jgi:hypothetical protein
MEALDMSVKLGIQYSQLSDIGDIDQIHIRVGIVLAGHAPDEGIVAGAAA